MNADKGYDPATHGLVDYYMEDHGHFQFACTTEEPEEYGGEVVRALNRKAWFFVTYDRKEIEGPFRSEAEAKRAGAELLEYMV